MARPPKPLTKTPEAVYLITQNSTETTIARAPQMWVTEDRLSARTSSWQRSEITRSIRNKPGWVRRLPQGRSFEQTREAALHHLERLVAANCSEERLPSGGDHASATACSVSSAVPTCMAGLQPSLQSSKARPMSAHYRSGLSTIEGPQSSSVARPQSARSRNLSSIAPWDATDMRPRQPEPPRMPVRPSSAAARKMADLEDGTPMRRGGPSTRVAQPLEPPPPLRAHYAQPLSPSPKVFPQRFVSVHHQQQPATPKSSATPSPTPRPFSARPRRPHVHG